MRILYVADASNNHTVKWVNSMLDRGHEIHLAFQADDNPNIDIVNPNVFLHKLSFKGKIGYYLNVLELKGIIKMVVPDVVHAHFASGYGTLARLANPTKSILSVWGSDVYEFPLKNKFFYNTLLKNLINANVVTSSSNNMKNHIERLYPKEKINIKIVPFGVDTELFSRLNYSDRSKDNLIIIGNIKSLEPIYGIEYLIKAVHLLIINLENKGLYDLSRKIQLRIYGDGSERINLEKLVTELGLSKQTVFFGRIANNEVPKVLEELDIFCVTSNQESFGVALLEAMALELPVVATNTPGFEEIVDDEITGFIVEKKNPVEIATALETLVLDTKARISMGMNGRKKVLNEYDWRFCVDLMQEIYESI